METIIYFYYIVFRGQSPILESLHMKERDHGLESLRPAEQSNHTDQCSSKHLCPLAMAGSKLVEFYCLGFPQGTQSTTLPNEQRGYFLFFGSLLAGFQLCLTCDHKDSTFQENSSSAE